MTVTGKRKSEPCEVCGAHPTRRVYIKKSNVFRGIAWRCGECGHYTEDLPA